MVYYSQIREQLNIKPLVDTENKQAFLTHYLHSLNSNTVHYFSEPVSKYYPSIPKELLFDQQASIDFKWDVPFPAPENPSFSFIDLFAGIGGIRMGFQNVRGKCVFSSEWDKNCSIS